MIGFWLSINFIGMSEGQGSVGNAEQPFVPGCRGRRLTEHGPYTKELSQTGRTDVRAIDYVTANHSNA